MRVAYDEIAFGILTSPQDTTEYIKSEDLTSFLSLFHHLLLIQHH